MEETNQSICNRFADTASCIPATSDAAPQSIIHFFVSAVELDFDPETSGALTFMQRHFHSVLWLSVAYLLCCGLANWTQHSRRPYRVPHFKRAWNLGLALFSLMGASRLVPTMLYVTLTRGLEAGVCAPAESVFSHGAAGLWTLLFVLSKVPEMGDTLLLAMEGKRLRLLQVWHHSSVLAWSWMEYTRASSICGYFAAMNFSVHAVMYFYFFAVSMNSSLRRSKLAMFVTAMQCGQMAVGLGLVIKATAVHLAGRPCHTSVSSLAIQAAVYASYLLLFLNFAAGAYGLPARFAKWRAVTKQD